MKYAAVICAAGQGKRMGLGENKQFLELNGKPLLIHTLQVWEGIKEIKERVVVVGQGEKDRVQALVEHHGLSRGNMRFVYGGKERQDSVYAGLKALQESPPDKVLIHDGARPLIQPQHIYTVMKSSKQKDAVTIGVPVKDTIKEVSAGRKVMRTLDRSTLWSIQTPQAFTYALLLQIHEKASMRQPPVTDDAALMERLGIPVTVVHGATTNLKLTTPEDIAYAEFLLQRSGQHGISSGTGV